jgi:L-fuculose-phosphate aldolase
MESLEFYAQLLYQSKMLGGPKLLTDEQVQGLYEIRRQFGLKGKHPADL